ncbi:helix-turn-helix transcriptional regulator [Microlunatus parietis]|uniref:DNA-binding CsgD family transcriptional regulator n=1 Tax=Microlunatus parietis TaxID=682979 RepID=A0A7Y9IEI6_9ACTN|nr:LuxR C-terminal-related transcriptional regulator [Microlunatus parietis]NYE74749.1 DNA-binding CsgD family transcriptional regulator [Microlunatus parietis]
MWEDRADRVRREITDLAVGGAGVADVQAAAITLVDRAVPSELTCWATLDPETLMITGMVGGPAKITAEYEERLAAAEYGPGEPHTFAELAREHRVVARLSELPERDLARSGRYHEVWRPLGLDRDVRVLFADAGAYWGAAGFVRHGADFTAREAEFLAAVAPAVGASIRMAVRAEASRAGGRPAIVVLGADGTIRAVTAAAADWRDSLDEIAPGRFQTMMRVLAYGARNAGPDGFHGRLRDARGRWAQLEASRLIGAGDERIVITIEPSSGDRLLALLLAAYGLSVRERDLCAEVLAGRSTAEIADRLFISPHTVQDHLKSIFGKVGVHSRGELVARLRPAAGS